MRGFLVLFDTQRAMPRMPEHPFEQQLAAWERRFTPQCLHRLENPHCRFYLYTANETIPAAFNQSSWHTPSELRLWVGPRVDMTPAALLQAPVPHHLPELAAATSQSPAVLDTAVCLSYSVAQHSLIVKTDLLNSTYVYWTRSGRWLLLSNSSLTLAQLTRAGLDWVAVSEFLASGSIYGNHSLYQDIHTLKPATLYAFADGTSCAEHQYWRLDTLPFNTLSAREACHRIVAELDSDYDALNATGKTFILDLTGGYDSRTNLGFALRRLQRFQTTVSGLAGDEDVVISSALARHFGLQHKVIPPVEHDDPRQAERLADAVLLTDLEYDIIEYARIYHAQSQFDTLCQPSVHGSGGGDLARNIILRREFYEPTPDGRLVMEPLIAQRFANLIPATSGQPDLPIADWVAHIRSRIAEYDVPALPAFARLDILYLRMRMQFWQARISSSTNRFRASFSPWTNRKVLEAMLTTRWRERRHQMLSRLLLHTLHPDLSKFVVARGEPGGPSRLAALVALPARLRYYRTRLSVRLGWSGTAANADAALYRHYVPQWEEIVARVLRPEAVSSMTAGGGLTMPPQVLGRLVTLAHVKESLNVF